MTRGCGALASRRQYPSSKRIAPRCANFFARCANGTDRSRRLLRPRRGSPRRARGASRWWTRASSRIVRSRTIPTAPAPRFGPEACPADADPRRRPLGGFGLRGLLVFYHVSEYAIAWRYNRSTLSSWLFSKSYCVAMGARARSTRVSSRSSPVWKGPTSRPRPSRGPRRGGARRRPPQGGGDHRAAQLHPPHPDGASPEHRVVSHRALSLRAPPGLPRVVRGCRHAGAPVQSRQPRRASQSPPGASSRTGSGTRRRNSEECSGRVRRVRREDTHVDWRTLNPAGEAPA